MSSNGRAGVLFTLQAQMLAICQVARSTSLLLPLPVRPSRGQHRRLSSTGNSFSRARQAHLFQSQGLIKQPAIQVQVARVRERERREAKLVDLIAQLRQTKLWRHVIIGCTTCPNVGARISFSQA